MRIIRGLATPASIPAFSLDGQTLAVLEHGWRIGIWDMKTGFLQHMVEVPAGKSADNADIAFGPGGLLAFSAGKQATLYQIHATRVEWLETWKLYEGLVDRFGELRPEGVILARTEAKDGVWEVAEQHPRVIRVRELRPGREPIPLYTITDFDNRVFGARITRDGRFLVACGKSGPNGEKKLL